MGRGDAVARWHAPRIYEIEQTKMKIEIEIDRKRQRKKEE